MRSDHFTNQQKREDYDAVLRSGVATYLVVALVGIILRWLSGSFGYILGALGILVSWGWFLVRLIRLKEKDAEDVKHPKAKKAAIVAAWVLLLAFGALFFEICCGGYFADVLYWELF